MLNHQTAVLDDFDACSGELLRHLVVSYTGLKPHGLRLFGQHIIDVTKNVMRAAKDIDKIDVSGDIDQPSVDRLPQNFFDIRVVDRHGNHFETCRVQILGDVECGLRGLPFRFDAKDSDAPGL